MREINITSLKGWKLEDQTSQEAKILIQKLKRNSNNSMLWKLWMIVHWNYVKTFENPSLRYLNHHLAFPNLEFSRIFISKPCWELREYIFIDSLSKLSNTKIVDIAMANNGYQYISLRQRVWEWLPKLKIRTLSLIQIHLNHENSSTDFMNWVSKIKTLQDFEYSYHPKSPSKEGLDIHLLDWNIKVTNRTKTKFRSPWFETLNTLRENKNKRMFEKEIVGFNY